MDEMRPLLQAKQSAQSTPAPIKGKSRYRLPTEKELEQASFAEKQEMKQGYRKAGLYVPGYDKRADEAEFDALLRHNDYLDAKSSTESLSSVQRHETLESYTEVGAAFKDVVSNWSAGNAPPEAVRLAEKTFKESTNRAVVDFINSSSQEPTKEIVKYSNILGRMNSGEFVFDEEKTYVLNMQRSAVDQLTNEAFTRLYEAEQSGDMVAFRSGVDRINSVAKGLIDSGRMTESAALSIQAEYEALAQQTGITEEAIQVIQKSGEQIDALLKARANIELLNNEAYSKEKEDKWVEEDRVQFAKDHPILSATIEMPKGVINAMGSAILSVAQLPSVFELDSPIYSGSDMLYEGIKGIKKNPTFRPLPESAPAYSKAAYELGSAVGSIATLAAGGPSRAATIGIAFITSEADAYQHAKDMGMKDGDAAMYSTFISMVTAVSEGIVPDGKYFAKQASDSVLKAVRGGKSMKQAIQLAMKQMPKSVEGYLETGGKEGLEEGISYMAGVMAEETADIVSGHNYYAGFSEEEFRKNILLGAAAGNFMRVFRNRGGNSPIQESVMMDMAANADAVVDGLKGVSPEMAVQAKKVLTPAQDQLEVLQTHSNWSKLSQGEQEHIFSLTQQRANIETDIAALKSTPDKSKIERAQQLTVEINALLNKSKRDPLEIVEQARQEIWEENKEAFPKMDAEFGKKKFNEINQRAIEIAQKADPKREPGIKDEERPVRVTPAPIQLDIAHAERQVEANPTEGQKEAGNYRKGHISVHGLDVTIENPKGSQRTGTDSKGNKWSVTMNDTYGYIKRTEGADGDHLDVFIGPNPESEKVFVVDQKKGNGKFDEHKIVMGYETSREATKAYMSNYSKGWKGMGGITEMTIQEFKEWVKTGDTKNPLAKKPEPKPHVPPQTYAETEYDDVNEANTPEELGALYRTERHDPTAVDHIDMAIASAGVGRNVRRESFLRFNDANNITMSIARTYFNKQGSTLDQIAQAATYSMRDFDSSSGEEITPGDVADFMIRHPNGFSPRTPASNPKLKAISEKYGAMTGKSIDKKVAERLYETFQKAKKDAALKERLEQKEDILRKLLNENESIDVIIQNIDDEAFFTQFPMGLLPTEYEALKQTIKSLSDEQIRQFRVSGIEQSGGNNRQDPDDESGYVFDPGKGYAQKVKGNDGQLLLFSSEADMHPSEFPEVNGYSPKVEGDTITWMERQIEEKKGLEFMTGSAVIKNAGDVAYLFRHLESAATENVFAVLVDSKGEYRVLYVSSGGTTSSIVDGKLIAAAAKEFGATSVTLVHNHPTGRLVSSGADQQMFRNLQNVLEPIGISLEDGVVINLDSGKYLTFTDAGDTEVAERPTFIKDEKRVRVHEFSKQILYTPSSEKILINDSESAAAFLSKQKRGLSKISVVILSNDNKVNRYLLVDDSITAYELSALVIAEIGKHGESVIFSYSGDNAPAIKTAFRVIRKAGFSVRDVIEVESDSSIIDAYKSWRDVGLLEEQKETYTSASKERMKEIDARIRDIDSEIVGVVAQKEKKKREVGEEINSAQQDLFGERDADKKASEQLFAVEADFSSENRERVFKPFNDKIQKLQDERNALVRERQLLPRGKDSQLSIDEQISQDEGDINNMAIGGILMINWFEHMKAVRKLGALMSDYMKKGVRTVGEFCQKSGVKMSKFVKDLWARIKAGKPKTIQGQVIDTVASESAYYNALKQSVPNNLFQSVPDVDAAQQAIDAIATQIHVLDVMSIHDADNRASINSARQKLHALYLELSEDMAKVRERLQDELRAGEKVFDLEDKLSIAGNARITIEDDFLWQKKVQQAILKTGKRIEDAEDPYMQRDIAIGKIKNAVDNLHIAIFGKKWGEIAEVKSQRPSLLQRAKQEGISQTTIDFFMYVQHAKERNARVKKMQEMERDAKIKELEEKIADIHARQVAGTPISSEDKGLLTRFGNELKYWQTKPIVQDGSGMSDDEADRYMAVFDERPDEKVVIENYAEAFRNTVIRPAIERMFEAGIITEDSFDSLMSGVDLETGVNWQYYVPMKVNGGLVSDGKKSYIGTTNPIKRLKGTDRFGYIKRNSPFAQAIVDAESAIKLAQDNETKQALYKLVSNNPNASVWGIESAQYVVKTNEQGEVVQATEIAPSGSAVPVMVDGKKKYVLLYHKGLADAWIRTGYQPNRFVNLIFKIWNGYNNFKRTILTVGNPVFGARNKIRDMQTALFNASGINVPGIGRRILSNHLRVMRVLFKASYTSMDPNSKDAVLINEYLQAGGRVSWIDSATIQDKVNSIVKLSDKFSEKATWVGETAAKTKQVWEVLKGAVFSLNEIMELSTRVSVFEALRNAGVSPDKAAAISKNATVNFNKKGTATPFINMFYLFLNAGIQGNIQSMRTVVKSKKAKGVAAALVLAGMGYVYWTDYLIEAFSDDEEDEERFRNLIMDSEKEGNYIIPLGTSYDDEGVKQLRFVKIPKDYGAMRIFFNLGESLAGITKGESVKRHTANWVGSATAFIDPVTGNTPNKLSALTPTIFRGPVEVNTNRKWNDVPIMPEQRYGPPLPDHELYFQNVTPFFKKLTENAYNTTGGEIDVSPETLEYILDDFTGGIIKEAKNGVIELGNYAKGREVDKNKIPFYGDFVVDIAKQDWRMQQRFYELYEQSAKRVFLFEERKELEQIKRDMIRLGIFDSDTAMKKMDEVQRAQDKLKQAETKQEVK